MVMKKKKMMMTVMVIDFGDDEDGGDDESDDHGEEDDGVSDVDKEVNDDDVMLRQKGTKCDDENKIQSSSHVHAVLPVS